MSAAADDRERRARRRAAIRRYHPDAGGTAQELAAALGALDQPRPAVSVVPTMRGRLRRFLRRRRGQTPRNLQ